MKHEMRDFLTLINLLSSKTVSVCQLGTLVDVWRCPEIFNDENKPVYVNQIRNSFLLLIRTISALVQRPGNRINDLSKFYFVNQCSRNKRGILESREINWKPAQESRKFAS